MQPEDSWQSPEIAADLEVAERQEGLEGTLLHAVAQLLCEFQRGERTSQSAVNHLADLVTQHLLDVANLSQPATEPNIANEETKFGDTELRLFGGDQTGGGEEKRA